MGTSASITMTILALFVGQAMAVERQGETLTLYQIGSNGRYCVSMSTSDKGCISGTRDDGSTVNLMNLMKGRTVVFQNLSDAPHDMKFSGANAEDLPPQAPQGPAAQKKMGQEDPNKEKISCTFHGNMLAVGYKVVPQFQQAIGPGGGHQDPITGGGGPQAEGRMNGPMVSSSGVAGDGGLPNLGKMISTGLADVAKQILSKGRSDEVSALVGNRPDLLPALQQVRPLLAKELAASMPPGAKDPALAGMVKTALGGAGGQGLDIGGAGGAGGVGGAGKKTGGAGGTQLASAGGAGGGGALSPKDSLMDKLGQMEDELEEGTVGERGPASEKADKTKKGELVKKPADTKVAAKAAGQGLTPSDRLALAMAGLNPFGDGEEGAGAGGAGGRDKTRLRIVNDTLVDEDPSRTGINGHKVAILALLLSTLLLARAVFRATGKKGSSA